MVLALDITSPKRDRHRPNGWEGFFPYYAGFPEEFAARLLRSANLREGAVVLDPWNGSGTTTRVAAELGLRSIGADINPVMTVVARARLLPASEADVLRPLASEICAASKRLSKIDPSDPLLQWFDHTGAVALRSLERQIRRHSVGSLTIQESGVNLDNLSGVAASFYVALFAICRRFAAPLRSSNPTWLRKPTISSVRISVQQEEVMTAFKDRVSSMAAALSMKSDNTELALAASDIRLSDSTLGLVEPESVDFVLTSPPYCTRIDYTAATRIELAVIFPLMNDAVGDLSRKMLGSIRVPVSTVVEKQAWGAECTAFLDRVRSHKSKASSGYYLKTHADYFDKLDRSLGQVSSALKNEAVGVFVVQDSYYKDVHNDLPTILEEMASSHRLHLIRRENFRLSRTLAGCHPHVKAYQRDMSANEAVLCFQKTT